MNKEINTDYRDSHEVHIQDHDLARMIWKFIKTCVPQEYQGRKLVGAHYKTFYLLRYTSGQKFACHRDGHSTNSKEQKSLLTALIYLNSDCKGGQTRFYGEPEHELDLLKKTGSDENGEYYDANPSEGVMALMRHYILHSAMPVTKGKKYALRFNILYESYGEWYAGPPTDAKFKGVAPKLPPYVYDKNPIEEAWDAYILQRIESCLPVHVYKFLPDANSNEELGRPPSKGEGFCDNCYEILDLSYDYYSCPRCESPVIFTQRII